MVAVAFALPRAPVLALRGLRYGAAVVLLLVTLAAPTVLLATESARDLFRAAAGREVLAWGAWRTVWMSGYFYNDGHVREAEGLPEIVQAAQRGTVLVVCGPGEQQQLRAVAALRVRTVATGPRRNALLEVGR
jgi:hypothetical protein